MILFVVRAESGEVLGPSDRGVLKKKSGGTAR